MGSSWHSRMHWSIQTGIGCNPPKISFTAHWWVMTHSLGTAAFANSLLFLSAVFPDAVFVVCPFTELLQKLNNGEPTPICSLCTSNCFQSTQRWSLRTDFLTPSFFNWINRVWAIYQGAFLTHPCCPQQQQVSPFISHTFPCFDFSTASFL